MDGAIASRAAQRGQFISVVRHFLRGGLLVVVDKIVLGQWALLGRYRPLNVALWQEFH